MKKQVVLWMVFLVFGLQWSACAMDPNRGSGPMPAATDTERTARLIAAGDEALGRYRQALDRIMHFVSTHPELFLPDTHGGRPLRTTAQRRQLRQVWQSFLDYILALDAVNAEQSRIYKAAGGGSKDHAFAVLYAAFLCQYRYALDFLHRVEADQTLDTILNEGDPELGLEEKTYSEFKFRFLNVAIATHFVALNTLANQYHIPDGLAAPIREDRTFIWRMGKGKGEAMTLKNALTIIQGAGFSAWFPVQKGIAEWMGDIKVWRQHRTLIGAEQIRQLPVRLQPGDILLERREWYLSNVGLPGFWSHVALYVGTMEERKAFFKDDPELCRWIADQAGAACNLETLLQARHPRAYAQSIILQDRGDPPRVIEAIGEGVALTTLEHSAACDSLAVLRPRLSRLEKARAIDRAFHYVGRPYDFNFDFMTDAALVCSELIYKCYEPSGVFKGIVFPLTDMMGRKVTPPNDMARQFDRNWGSDRQQTDLVIFLDGHEPSAKAFAADLATFRDSWRRPKWHILLPRAAPGPPSP